MNFNLHAHFFFNCKFNNLHFVPITAKNVSSVKEYETKKELPEPLRRTVRSFPNKPIKGSETKDYVFVNLVKSCPLDVDKTAPSGTDFKENASVHQQFSPSGGNFNGDDTTVCSDAPVEGTAVAGTIRVTSNKNSNVAEIQCREEVPQCGASTTSASSKTLAPSFGSVDTLAVTELEIWSEINRRLAEQAKEEDGTLKSTL